LSFIDFNYIRGEQVRGRGRCDAALLCNYWSLVIRNTKHFRWWNVFDDIV